MSEQRLMSCPECGNCVAVQREGGAWELRHKKRTVLVKPEGLLSVQCEQCGHVWAPQSGMTGRLAMPTLRRVA